MTCNHCGAKLAADRGRCPECDKPISSPPQQDLRVDPGRLEDALSVTGEGTTEGAWGRADEAASEDPSALVRLSELMLEPLRTPQPAPPAAEPEAAEPVPAQAPDDPEPEAETDETGEQAQGEDEDASEPLTIPPAHRPSGPPVLASEALQRELSPIEPGIATSRWLTACCGLAGIGLAVGILGPGAASVPIAVGFLSLLTLALAPMPYTGRAAALTTIAGAGVLTASLVRFRPGFDATAVGLMLVVIVLASALHLRAWHRASDLARILVALGLAAGIAWLAAKGSLTDLSTLDANWRASIPRVMQIPFGLLLMVSLLAFMDGRTTGGCTAWAVGLWLWYAVFVGLELLARVWLPGGIDWSALPRAQVISMLVTPLLTPIVGVGAAQLLASALGRHVRAAAPLDDRRAPPEVGQFPA